MTKYILVGGYDSKAEDGGKAFCEEVVDGFDQPARILVCLFSRPEEEWNDAFEASKLFFATNLRNQKLLLTLARPEMFVVQLRKTDAVYFRGGNTGMLLETLSSCAGWEKELEGKTVVGSSAGANFLATYSYGLTNLIVRQGLGILPIKVLVHYKSDYNAPNVDWDKAYKELEAYGEKLPVMAIREGEFVVMEQ